MSKEERLDYLESERVKIWAKITDLTALVENKTSDYEAAAKVSADNALAFEEKSKTASDQIAKDLAEATTKLTAINANYNAFEDLQTKIKGLFDTASANSESVASISTAISSKSAAIQTQISEIEKIFNNKPVLDENIVKLDAVFKRGDDYDSKLGGIFKSITDRKKEIDELYYEVFGSTIKDEAGKETKIEGKRDELENSYVQIKVKTEEIGNELTELKTTTEKGYQSFIENRLANFNDAMAAWQNDHERIKKEISALLPNALTAGLSSAYSEKKQTEESERKSYSTTFKWAIAGLVAVSTIPLLFSLKSIADKTSLEEVILRIPRLVLAILPLYIPVLWVAYSSNKKMNLSKRLVEEYSHKEVLSKTFEGLSGQINNISDKEISADLKIKLLYNILEVNSENPGKLISDYDKSDHPLMDALDKSVKLTNAVTKLAKIPGFAKLATTLGQKSEAILLEEGKKADAGLNGINVPPKTPVKS